MHLENRNLLGVPAAERAGLLFVIAAPAPGADLARLFVSALPEDLERELDIYQLGKHQKVAEQTYRIDANWKMVHDTFGEAYHFTPLHPDLGLYHNLCLFTEFGDHARRTNYCRFTVEVMAKGEVPESHWAEPSIMHHLVMQYQLASNLVLIVSSVDVQLHTVWPGPTAGESTINITLHTHKAPTRHSLQAFKKTLYVVATQDFPSLPRMQANFTENRHAEVVFGRHEPCLVHGHRWWDGAVRGRY